MFVLFRRRFGPFFLFFFHGFYLLLPFKAAEKACCRTQTGVSRAPRLQRSLEREREARERLEAPPEAIEEADFGAFRSVLEAKSHVFRCIAL